MKSYMFRKDSVTSHSSCRKLQKSLRNRSKNFPICPRDFLSCHNPYSAEPVNHSLAYPMVLVLHSCQPELLPEYPDKMRSAPQAF